MAVIGTPADGCDITPRFKEWFQTLHQVSKKVQEGGGMEVELAGQEASVGLKTTTAEQMEPKIPTAEQTTTTVKPTGPKIPTVGLTELKTTYVELTRQMTPLAEQVGLQ